MGTASLQLTYVYGTGVSCLVVLYFLFWFHAFQLLCHYYTKIIAWESTLSFFSNTFQVITICVDEENEMKTVATQTEATALDRAEAGTCSMDVRKTSLRLYDVISNIYLTRISLVLSCVS